MYTFILFIVLAAVFLFITATCFSFKEEYKKHYKKLFEKNGIRRPLNWELSRQKNHDIYHACRWITILLLILAVIFGMLYDFSLLLICIMISLIVILPIGIICGKYLCRYVVKKQCKKFNIQCTKDWIDRDSLKNLQDLLKILFIIIKKLPD